MAELIEHLMRENKRYRDALRRIRDAINSIPLFCTPEEEVVAHRRAITTINEILEEVGL